jgi:hypothetical protein
MEAKCDGCSKVFQASDLRVSYNNGEYRFLCWSEETRETCRRPGHPILVKYMFPWEEIMALRAYLDGVMDADILDRVDEFKANVDQQILEILRRVVLKNDDEIQESDS